MEDRNSLQTLKYTEEKMKGGRYSEAMRKNVNRRIRENSEKVWREQREGMERTERKYRETRLQEARQRKWFWTA